MSIRFSKIIFLLITLSLIAGLAFGLREYASHRMIADFDEPFYMDLALKYGNAIRDGQYKMVAWIDKNAEHPILGKMVFTFALLTKPRLEKFYHKDLEMLYPISKDALPYMLAAPPYFRSIWRDNRCCAGIVESFCRFFDRHPKHGHPLHQCRLFGSFACFDEYAFGTLLYCLAQELRPEKNNTILRQE